MTSAASLVAGKKLGILLAAHPRKRNFAHAIALANRALDRGAHVYIYFLDEAAPGLDGPAVADLHGRGAKILACSTAPGGTAASSEIAVRTGLGTLSDLIASTDRFVSFT